MGDTAQGSAAGLLDIEIPACSICFCEYGPGIRKPWDLGCGHCICNRCYANLSISGPKTCPVDRKEWNNPHPSYELLHVVEQLQKGRAKPSRHDAEGSFAQPGHVPAVAQHQATRRRWRPPDPFRPAADLLLLLSDLWRAVTWPPAPHDSVGEASGGDADEAWGMGMELREAMGHLATAAPPWMHIAWRLAFPGLCVLAAHMGWRYLAALALMLAPLFVATSTVLEVRERSWPMIAACAAAGLLGASCCLTALLRHGLLQHLLCALLLALLAAGIQHARVCNCMLATICRSRWLQGVIVGAAGALWWMGLAASLRRSVLQGALRAALRLGAFWPGLAELELGPAGAGAGSAGFGAGLLNGSGADAIGAVVLEAPLHGTFAAAVVGAVGRGLRDWVRAVPSSLAAAAAADPRAPADVDVPPLALTTVGLLLLRGALTPTLLLVAVTYLEDYRSALPAGGPSILPGSRLGGLAAVYGSAYRYDLDWLLLRAAVFLGLWCCSGSFGLATASNVALSGCFLLIRLVAVNRSVLRLFRGETSLSSAAAALATVAAAARAGRGSPDANSGSAAGGAERGPGNSAGGGRVGGDGVPSSGGSHHTARRTGAAAQGEGSRSAGGGGGGARSHARGGRVAGSAAGSSGSRAGARVSASSSPQLVPVLFVGALVSPSSPLPPAPTSADSVLTSTGIDAMSTLAGADVRSASGGATGLEERAPPSGVQESPGHLKPGEQQLGRQEQGGHRQELKSRGPRDAASPRAGPALVGEPHPGHVEAAADGSPSTGDDRSRVSHDIPPLLPAAGAEARQPSSGPSESLRLSGGDGSAFRPSTLAPDPSLAQREELTAAEPHGATATDRAAVAREPAAAEDPGPEAAGPVPLGSALTPGGESSEAAAGTSGAEPAAPRRAPDEGRGVLPASSSGACGPCAAEPCDPGPIHPPGHLGGFVEPGSRREGSKDAADQTAGYNDSEGATARPGPHSEPGCSSSLPAEGSGSLQVPEESREWSLVSQGEETESEGAGREGADNDGTEGEGTLAGETEEEASGEEVWVEEATQAEETDEYTVGLEEEEEEEGEEGEEGTDGDEQEEKADGDEQEEGLSRKVPRTLQPLVATAPASSVEPSMALLSTAQTAEALAAAPEAPRGSTAALTSPTGAATSSEGPAQGAATEPDPPVKAEETGRSAGPRAGQLEPPAGAKARGAEADTLGRGAEAEAEAQTGVATVAHETAAGVASSRGPPVCVSELPAGEAGPGTAGHPLPAPPLCPSSNAANGAVEAALHLEVEAAEPATSRLSSPSSPSGRNGRPSVSDAEPGVGAGGDGPPLWPERTAPSRPFTIGGILAAAAAADGASTVAAITSGDGSDMSIGSSNAAEAVIGARTDKPPADSAAPAAAGPATHAGAVAVRCRTAAAEASGAAAVLATFPPVHQHQAACNAPPDTAETAPSVDRGAVSTVSTHPNPDPEQAEELPPSAPQPPPSSQPPPLLSSASSASSGAEVEGLPSQTTAGHPPAPPATVFISRLVTARQVLPRATIRPSNLFSAAQRQQQLQQQQATDAAPVEGPSALTSAAGTMAAAPSGRSRDLLAPRPAPTPAPTSASAAATSAVPRPHRHTGTRHGASRTGAGAGTSHGPSAAGRGFSASRGGSGRGGSGSRPSTSTSADAPAGSGAADRALSGTASILSAMGPPRGGLYDDVVWGFTAVVLLQWLLHMPPWSQLLAGLDRRLGPLALGPLLGWCGVVVMAGVAVQTFRLSSGSNLQGALRPCLAECPRPAGGGSGRLPQDPGGGSVVDVRHCIRFHIAMAAVPLAVHALHLLSRHLSAWQLALAANLDLVVRLALAFLQAVFSGEPIALSGAPAVPLLCFYLFRPQLPRALSTWAQRTPEFRALRVAVAMFASLVVGMDLTVSVWLSYVVVQAVQSVAAAWAGARARLAQEGGGSGSGNSRGAEAGARSRASAAGGPAAGPRLDGPSPITWVRFSAADTAGGGTGGGGSGGGDNGSERFRAAAAVAVQAGFPEGAILEMAEQLRRLGSGSPSWWSSGARNGAVEADRGRRSGGHSSDEEGGGGGEGGSDSDVPVLVTGVAHLGQAARSGRGGSGLTRRRLHARRSGAEAAPPQQQQQQPEQQQQQQQQQAEQQHQMRLRQMQLYQLQLLQMDHERRQRQQQQEQERQGGRDGQSESSQGHQGEGNTGTQQDRDERGRGSAVLDNGGGEGQESVRVGAVSPGEGVVIEAAARAVSQGLRRWRDVYGVNPDPE